jgi:transketolase
MRQQASMLEHFGKALVDQGLIHEELVVLDPDVAASTKVTYFAERFPERFIRVGISEQDMIGIAAGLAASGKAPIACGFAMFVACRSWEQIANSVARPGLNVKIVGSHSGLSPSADGDSHQTFGDIAMMRVLPNMTVVVPADALETVEALRALVNTPGPAYLRLLRGSTPIAYVDECDYTLGKANVLAEGADTTVIANGVMAPHALDAAEQLSSGGISVRVLDMHTVKPLDADSIKKAASETGAIVTAEEHSVIGGLGGAVAEVLALEHPTPMAMVGIKDRFGESSRSYTALLEELGLTSEAIAEEVRGILKRRK